MDNTARENNYNEPSMTNIVLEAPVQAQVKGDAKSFRKYGLLSLVFAIVYTFCLYKNKSGITYPIFMVITFGLIYAVRKSDDLPFLKDKNGKIGLNLFYVISLFLLSVTKCMFTSYSIQWLSGLAIFLLFFSFIMQLYIDTTGWDIVGWLGGIALTMIRPIANIAWPFQDFALFVKERGSETSKEKKNAIMAVLIGLIVAVPLLAVVVSLLVSADAVFSRILEKVFEGIHLPDNFGDIVGIVLTLCISFICAYIIPNSLYKKKIGIGPAKQGNINPLIAITFTVLLGLVYLLFCLIQVLFLFTGSMTLPAGYTYASYAHEGFYQLLAVCLINVALVSVCSRMFAKNKLLTCILSIIGICTYIMIASSAMRMILYIGAYTLTFLRLFVLWFLCVLSLWLAYLIIGLYKSDFPVFKAAMVTITVAYLAFAFANPDYQIAKYDLAHADMSDDTSTYGSVQRYIVYNLSLDSIPAIESNEQLLSEYNDNIYFDQWETNYEGSIRKFNYSYWRAEKVFEEEK
ncbi:MAG: DUF4173 domain-containing protein [Pseudobutyrivibrio ruminis]|uniref:DUF4153 domain-containing protein n=1 Tax=Pseudobutyrivibrio ruminis TaxID=46206 RepID=UPI0026ECD12A|nr:DUF4173 domain-containing protein [Pseudobutyrivibrio ruminis]MBE5913692.1 DUF4173 domain-containing protein [Pseudobutyrivibrio ruminis]